MPDQFRLLFWIEAEIGIDGKYEPLLPGAFRTGEEFIRSQCISFVQSIVA